MLYGASGMSTRNPSQGVELITCPLELVVVISERTAW
jgi:hypothetical protein